jgi:4-phytase/acid phosphatase
MRTKTLGSLIVAAVIVASGAATLLAQAAPGVSARPEFVVILTRHGVRAPTWTTERLNQYSVEAWPNWGVPPGYLTPHGRVLMQLFGAYYRAYFAQQGLLRASGCEDAEHLFLWADTDQRTIDSGRELAAGMFPGCSPKVGSLPQGTDDPLFSPLAFPIGHPDRSLAVASVLGRIGGDPGALLDAYQPALETMQQVLLGCTPGPNCPPVGKGVTQPLLGTPEAVVP